MITDYPWACPLDGLALGLTPAAASSRVNRLIEYANIDYRYRDRACNIAARPLAGRQTGEMGITSN